MSERSLSFVAICAVTFALLVDEIMLSAIFHVLLGAGSTVAAISIALVGFSASGVVAYVAPPLRDPARAAALLPGLLFAFGVSLMASSFLVMAVPISHGDLIYRANEMSVQLWRLAVYHIAVLPFFVGGLAIAVLLRANAAIVGRLYALDLAGSALGCLASPLLLSSLGAPRALLVAALPAVTLGGVLLWRRGGAKFAALLILPLGLLALDALAQHPRTFARLNTMGEVSKPGYRGFALDPDDLEFERWALDAWTIIRGPGIPEQWENFEGWGLSPRYEGPRPKTRLVNYNARFSTIVTEFDGDLQKLAPWIDADLTSLHHHIGRRFDRVLNIGAGGGREVLAALLHGAEHVTAVDVSDVVIDEVMQDHLLEFSGGLYRDPRVNPVAAEGRTFAERSQELFDLVEFSIVGGVNLEKMDLVRIDDLFTLEALRTYLARLEDDGIFSYVMYSTREDLVAEIADRDFVSKHPYVPVMRALTGLRLALEERSPGTHFADHVLIAALPGVIHPRYDLVHIVVGRSPFTALERERFVARTDDLGFTAVYPQLPGSAPQARGGIYERIVSAPELATALDALPFSVWPATDDRPFQYAFGAAHLARAFRHGQVIEVLSHNPLVSLGMVIGLLALAVTALPLLFAGDARSAQAGELRRVAPLMLIFACIGFAYMAVEIAALLRLHSYLGKPIYGLSVGLFAFLTASGLGSRLSEGVRQEDLTRFAHAAVAAVAVLGLLFYAFSNALFDATIALPLTARIPIAIAAVFPLACAMGTFFPVGIRLLCENGEDWVPWAWAVNGCFSVVGIFGARITALFVGFGGALLTGLAAYLCVALCVAFAQRRRATLA